MSVAGKVSLVTRVAAVLLPLVASGLFLVSAFIAPFGGTGSGDALLLSATLLAVALGAGAHLWWRTRTSDIAGMITGGLALVIVSAIFDRADKLGGSGYWQVAATAILLIAISGYDYLFPKRDRANSP